MSAGEDLAMILKNRGLTLEDINGLQGATDTETLDWVRNKLQSFGHENAQIDAAIRGAG